MPSGLSLADSRPPADSTLHPVKNVVEAESEHRHGDDARIHLRILQAPPRLDQDVVPQTLAGPKALHEESKVFENTESNQRPGDAQPENRPLPIRPAFYRESGDVSDKAVREKQDQQPQMDVPLEYVAPDEEQSVPDRMQHRPIKDQ